MLRSANAAMVSAGLAQPVWPGTNDPSSTYKPW